MAKRAPLEKPEPADLSGLMSAGELLYLVENSFPGMTHTELGAALGVSAGFVGSLLQGKREPSKKFLDAIGYERVALYRPKRG